MADRVVVTSGAAAGSRAPVGPRVARFIIAGQTQFGKTTGPEVVRSLPEYQAAFGTRSGGANMWDAAEFFFANNAGELVVQRASGPGAVRATVGLDSAKITVTARHPGAFYNGFTVAYTSATKTLTIGKPGSGRPNAVYSGADAAALAAAAAEDVDVTVTVTALPASDVAATNLATGTDDFANVSWSGVLSRITSLVGPGVMAVPGVPAAASALAAAANPRRWALLSCSQTDTDAQVITAQNGIASANKQYASYVNQWVTAKVAGVSSKPLDGVVVAGAIRAASMRVLGVGESPLRRQAHALVTGWAPLREIDDATHTLLEAAGVVTLRTLSSGPGVDVWSTAEGAGGNPNLRSARFRDLVNAITDDAYGVLDALYVGGTASPDVLSQAQSALKGVCESYVQWLTGGDGAGYRVSVSPGASPSDNRISAVISVRFRESIDWVDLAINYADAGQSL